MAHKSQFEELFIAVVSFFIFQMRVGHGFDPSVDWNGLGLEEWTNVRLCSKYVTC